MNERVRQFLGHPAHWVAMGLGSGLSPKAPGTVGTLWAWASYGVLQTWVDPADMGLVMVAALLIGWWSCTVSARRLAMADPGCIAWDEVVAFWLILWVLMPADFLTQLAAFAWFRFFDAVKPGPVGWADRVFKGDGWRGGWGILFDDLVAAFCTLLVFALWRSL